MRQVLLGCALLCAVPSCASARQADPSPAEAFTLAEKFFLAQNPWKALPLYRLASKSRNPVVARQALTRLLEIDERFKLFDRVVSDGKRFLPYLKDKEDLPLRFEVRVRIGLALEALAQYRLAETELTAVLDDLNPSRMPLLRPIVRNALARIASKIHPATTTEKRWREAEKTTVDLLDAKVALPLHAQAECVWLLSESYFQQKRYEDAIKRLNNLMRGLQLANGAIKPQIETLRRLASHQQANGAKPEAIAALRQALELQAKLERADPLLRPDLMSALAELYGSAGRSDEAESTRAQTVTAYQKLITDSVGGNPFTRSQAVWKLQKLYQQMHQYQRALALVSGPDATRLNTTALGKDPRMLAQQATLKLFTGAFKDARQPLLDAVATFQSAEILDLVELPRLLHSLAVVEQAMDHLKEADERGKQCLELYKKHRLPEDENLVETYNLLGTNAALQGEFAQGIDWFQQGVVCGNRLTPKNERLHSTLLLNQALLHKSQGDFAEAGKLCQLGLQAYQRSVDPDALAIALFQCALASLYVEQGKHEEAGKLALGVLAQCEKFGIRTGPLYQTAQHCRALGLLQQGKLPEAKQLWEELRLAQQQSEQYLLLPCTLNYLGLIHEILREHSTALGHYNQADTIQRKHSRSIPSTRCVTLWRMATMLDRKGEHDRARATLLEAIDVVEKARQTTYGDAQQRTSFLSQFVPIFEQAFVWTLRDGNVTEAVNLASRVRSRAFLDQLLMAGVDPRVGIPGAAGDLLRSREKDLATRITRLRANLALQAADASDEDRIRTMLATLEKTQEEFAGVWREILNASPAYRSLGDEQTIRQPLQAARQKILGKGKALLVYHMQRDRAFAMLVANEKAEAEIFELKLPVTLLADLRQPLPQASPLASNADRRGLAIVRRDEAPPLPDGKGWPPGTEMIGLNQGALWQLVEHYRCLLESPSFGTTRGLAVVGASEPMKLAIANLPDYAEVLLPTALRQRLEAIKPELLFVVPDGPLHKLPLEALLLQGGENPTFVLDRFPPMIYAPSMSGLVQLANRETPAQQGDRSLLTISNPAYPQKKTVAKRKTAIPPLLSGHMTRLPFTAEESARIRKVFPGDRVTSLEGGKATEEELTRALSSHRILHVAAHGFADKEFGNLFGALALVPPPAEQARPENDGFLTLMEIYRLRLSQCELAVLSACETNVGPQRPLEAGVTLASGFLAAGAHRVVASHWNVDDRSTAELMGTFFEELARKEQGVSYAQALQKARKKLREDPDTASPFFWAPFVLLSGRE